MSRLNDDHSESDDDARRFKKTSSPSYGEAKFGASGRSGDKPFRPPQTSSTRHQNSASGLWPKRPQRQIHHAGSGESFNSRAPSRSYSDRSGGFGENKRRGESFGAKKTGAPYGESFNSRAPSRSYSDRSGGFGESKRRGDSFGAKKTGAPYGKKPKFGDDFSGKQANHSREDRYQNYFSDDVSRDSSSYQSGVRRVGTGGHTPHSEFRRSGTNKTDQQQRTFRGVSKRNSAVQRGTGHPGIGVQGSKDLSSFSSWGSVARNGARYFGDTGEKRYKTFQAEKPDTEFSDAAPTIPLAKERGTVGYKLISSSDKKRKISETAGESSKLNTSSRNRKGAQKKPALVADLPAKRRSESLSHYSAKSFGDAGDLALKDIVSPKRLSRAESVLESATKAYTQDRFPEVISMLNSLGKEALVVPEVAELLGLTLYRQGKWSSALKILSSFTDKTGSLDQYPVLMDLNRALGRHRQVEKLYEELRQEGVSSDLMAEARIVMVGDLADRGKLQEAIKQMAPAASRPVKRPQMRHLRQWFVLADLYERVGEISLARDFYTKVLRADPSMADVAERLAALS